MPFRQDNPVSYYDMHLNVYNEKRGDEECKRTLRAIFPTK